MAIFNEILSGRYNRALQKIFAIKGSPPVRQLGGELMPVHQIFSGAENRYPENWNRFGVALNQPQTAAVVAGVRMRNPGNSNVIAVFEKILINNSSAAADQYNVRLEAQALDLATIVTLTTARLDPRGNPQPTLIASRSSSPGLFGTNVKGIVNLNTNTPFDFIGTDIQEITLLPGDALQVEDTVVNQQVVVSFIWRERLLEESERT